MELEWLGHPGLALILFIAWSFQFRDEVVEFRHSLVLSMFGVFHRVDKLLALDLKSAEAGLNFNIGLIEVSAHPILLKSYQTRA